MNQLSGTDLLVDIGNTHTVAGVAQRGSRELLSQARFRTDPHATADEYRAQLRQLLPQLFEPALLVGQNPNFAGLRTVISSVVPTLDRVINDALKHTGPVHFIRWDSPRKFELDLPRPEQLGADRLANVAGALALAKPPFLIVDAGTATTFCLVDERPAYIGGAITPGLEISWKALQNRAAKLFSIELNRPQTSVGNTTETQLQSGVLLGYEALIEGLTDRLLQDAGSEFSKRATLFATGGCVEGLQLSSRFQRVPDLTLLGLIQYGHML